MTRGPAILPVQRTPSGILSPLTTALAVLQFSLRWFMLVLPLRTEHDSNYIQYALSSREMI